MCIGDVLGDGSMNEVARVSIVQQVVNGMKDYIASGSVEAGQKLPTEKEWCEKFAVGRGTVREAIRILEARGLIELKPGKGAFAARIQEMGQEDLEAWFAQNELELKDYIEVRSAVEPLAARLAVEKCTDADIERLWDTHRAFVRAVDKHDVSAIAQLDEKFHRQIMEISDNKMLIMIGRQVDECIEGFRLKTFQLPQNAANALRPHENIINAIAARDGEIAEIYAKRHIKLINVDMDVLIKR